MLSNAPFLTKTFLSSSSSSPNLTVDTMGFPFKTGDGQSVAAVRIDTDPTTISLSSLTLDCAMAMDKEKEKIGREHSHFYQDFKAALIKAKNRNKHPVEVRCTDDSDNEEVKDGSSKNTVPHIEKTKSQQVYSCDMTIISFYYGKKIRFKGNQLITWARNMMQQVLEMLERENKIAKACSTQQATVAQPADWLNYEGMFESMRGMAAKKSEPFLGVLVVYLNESTRTTIECKKKENAPVTYSYLHDKALILFIINELGLTKYHDPAKLAMTYPNIVETIQCYQTYQKNDIAQTDSHIAKRQLEIFQGSVKGEITVFDRFLAFFNAVLFGSETSRNSTSFVTGLIILELIGKGELTYEEAFHTASKSKYAVYPMASPGAGKGNIVAYRELVHFSEEEAATGQLSSSIGMKDSRENPQWAQIHLKEALLLKYWSQNFGHEPVWMGASEDIRKNGHAVEFARRFNQCIASLLHRYFLPSEQKPLVYSQDELDHLSWGLKYSSSTNKWQEPEVLDSTVTNFDALKWYITTAKPMRLEKDIEDACYEILDSVSAETDI